MSVSGVENNVQNQTATQYNQATQNLGQVDKDSFLKLLVTQLQNQDPLNPMDDKEFIAQMAQFSTLEQIQNLNSTMEKSQTDILDLMTYMQIQNQKCFDKMNETLDAINKGINGETEDDSENENESVE
ncbi:flagellar hook assembly protein FlgD [Abyssisolibacter fermentans]|uniref:flagellar hook assembly protein FlgD n=1 Tax=Abyssisolibacter fermentans TaxID=1766203 RepID=UPI0009EA67B9|nr:flagellar hook capping FlgD N-terminal domain-containing protein [Abyssisolibacter fermentans]